MGQRGTMEMQPSTPSRRLYDCSVQPRARFPTVVSRWQSNLLLTLSRSKRVHHGPRRGEHDALAARSWPIPDLVERHGICLKNNVVLTARSEERGGGSEVPRCQ